MVILRETLSSQSLANTAINHKYRVLRTNPHHALLHAHHALHKGGRSVW